MYHFLTLSWNSPDMVATGDASRLAKLFRQSQPHWSCSLATEGFVVFSARPRERSLREYILPRGAGVVLGRLFPSTLAECSDSWEPQFNEHTATDIANTGGRRLIEEYWGAYVAFLKACDGRRYVLRDCSGRLPCYRTRHGSVEIIFSDIEDLASLELPPFTLNKRYLAGFVFSSQLQIRECGVNEVTEVLAGECVEFHQSSIRQSILWDPHKVARKRSIEDCTHAIGELKRVTQGCINAWASTYDSILLSLSGGFDSAVVLGCLSNAPRAPKISGINFFTSGTHDDERRYARLAAKQAGVELIEQPLVQQELDLALCMLPKIPKPAVNTILSMLDIELINAAAADTGAEAIWTGQGGDHLFWQVADSFSAVDYVARQGINLGLVSTIADAARITRIPYATVLRTALQLGRSPKTWAPDVVHKLKAHFVNSEILGQDAIAYVTNQSIAGGADAIPKGKQLQIYFLAEVLNRHRPNPGLECVFQHHPLLSQPLLELCLQIPIYVLLRGGRQRALARQAFADRVPAEIIRREDKGNSYARNRELIRRSEGALRELLLDGILVRERIVDRNALEPYLVRGESYRADQFWPLLACIAGEFWTRSWAHTSLRIAA